MNADGNVFLTCWSSDKNILLKNFWLVVNIQLNTMHCISYKNDGI